ncbi:MAG: 30S ribosomal protein S19e, partial [Thermoplasmata archaeon]|nr:30S ribosomal protein S19e [Thermoplasmata archaeon]
MTTAYDVPASSVIESIARKLKEDKTIQAPEWTPYVKTGVHKEMPPDDPDWWYTRLAAVLRKVYMKGPIGVARLTAEFGGSRDRGAKPNRARKGSGSVARKCIQQLEELGYVKKNKT